VPRRLVLPAYCFLLVIWSSTWVAIKIGLEDTPPFYGAGIRFAFAGVVLLVVARALRRPLKSDPLLVAVLAVLPFALSYGLIYWSEQYIPSGLAAVLFGVMPLYVAILSALYLREEPVTRRIVVGVFVALFGLAAAFGESIALGHEERALLGAAAALTAPLASAIGNLSIKLRGSGLDPIALNGWAMLGGGVLLLAVSAPSEDWSQAVWSAQAIGAIAYLALIGSAIAFVLLTMLLHEMTAIQAAYIPLIIPFGALAFGAALYDEPITALAVAGAALVGGGLLVAQWPRRAKVPAETRS
jgi:drug/metabolite transporter (DMT)-like permease